MDDARAWRRWVAIALLAYVVCVVRTAWLCDDAYITFRTVENVVAGHGPRWNLADRVQTFTHPLWMWILSGLRLLSGEIYFTALALGGVLSLVAIGLLAGTVAIGARGAVVVVALLASSRAFVDYSTSGLENPLVHLFLVAFTAIATTATGSLRSLRWLALLAGLTACTRADLLLLQLPVLTVLAWRHRWLPAARALAIGFAPFLAWSAFATFYYGFPYPNTAQAKLFGLGVPMADLWRQGWLYLRTTALHDPATALGLAAGTAAAVLGGGPARLLGVGVLLQVAYVVSIGGDFMLGRFLTPPLVVAAACLARATWLRRGPGPWVALATLAVAVALCPRITFFSGRHYVGEGQVARGIWDERGSYYGHLGLLSPGRAPFAPSSSTVFDRIASEARPEIRVVTTVGGPGFYGGGRLHIVDPFVCDPLLARLPAIEPAQWRPGHTMRRVPEGYFESIAHGDNRILHPGLAAFYDDLAQVTRGPLFDGARLRALLRLLLGERRGGLQTFVAEHYYTPPVRSVTAEALQRSVRDWTRWNDVDAIVLGEGGLSVRFAETMHATTFAASLMSGGHYRFSFALGDEERGSTDVVTPRLPIPLLRGHTAAVPDKTRSFDRIRVLHLAATSSEPVAAIAALLLDPDESVAPGAPR
ncbi:MAG: hypothetical protein R3F56_12200 [Planctomycetota bacterium]